MKRLFKHIIRKVDEKVSNSIKEIKETIKAIKEFSNDRESKNTIANISLCLGSALTMYGIITKLELMK